MSVVADDVRAGVRGIESPCRFRACVDAFLLSCLIARSCLSRPGACFEEILFRQKACSHLRYGYNILRSYRKETGWIASTSASRKRTMSAEGQVKVDLPTRRYVRT